MHYTVVCYECTFAFTAGLDYSIATPVFSLTISAGTKAAFIDVNIIDDTIHEDQETFNIAITLLPSCLSLSLGFSQTTIKIIDSDSTCVCYASHLK